MAKMNWGAAAKRDLVRDRGADRIGPTKAKKPHGKKPKGVAPKGQTVKAHGWEECATCRRTIPRGTRMVLAKHGWVHHNCPPKTPR